MDERIEPTGGPNVPSSVGIWLNRATYPLDPSAAAGGEYIHDTRRVDVALGQHDQ